MEWVYYIVLILVLLTGLVLNVLTLPGNWVMLLADLAFGWATKWRHIGWKWLVVLLLIAVAAEVVEFMAAGSGAKKAGGRIWGTIGALVGAVLGAIFLSFVPIPVLSTLIGILLGTFLGALAAELLTGQEVGRSFLIGYGAAKGRLYGTLLKIGAGCAIILLSMIAALPLGGSPAKAAGPRRTGPATMPVSGPATPTSVPVTAPGE